MNNQKKSAVRVGIGGPVGAGKTSFTAAIVKDLKQRYSVGVITNDIYTKEDAEALMRMQILPEERLICLLYTSPSPRDGLLSRMPSSA